MLYCQNCGANIDPNASHCPYCGAANANKSENSADSNTQSSTEDSFKKAFDTVNIGNDHTNEYAGSDIESNVAMAILCYIGPLFLIPLFACKNSPYVKFHINQGLILFIAELLIGIVSAIPFLHIIGILNVATLVLTIIGIVNVAQGKAKELPIIGSIKILS